MPTGYDAGLARRHAWTLKLDDSPYDARIYLERARCHEALGYFDLAASDAYKALLLTDEVLEEDGEYHEQAFEAIIERIRADLSPDLPPHNVSGAPAAYDAQADVSRTSPEAAAVREPGADVHGSSAEEVAEDCSRSAYEILSRTLLGCGDLKSAWDFVERGLKAFPINQSLQALKNQILGTDEKEIRESGPKHHDLPERGLVRREIYPWNTHESDRFSPANLALINAELFKVAPKCEIRVVELPCLDTAPSAPKPTKTIKQLGIFAKANIAPGETVLCEPSILAATNRLHDPLCDACSSPLPAAPDADADADAAPLLPTCPDCDDTAFCSTACFADAQRLYHPAVCGSQQDFDISAKDPSPHAATDALYLLLLARTIAMAETQDIHPLELPEIKFLWGDFAPSTSSPSPAETAVTTTLPFTFHTSILQPLHLLESLDKDIFSPATRTRYDTWVVNTLMAKYRGVASARMNARTGVPEACAVHWRWSLANHSCAPNVRWEWPARAGRAGGDGGGGGEQGGHQAAEEEGTGNQGMEEEEEEKQKGDERRGYMALLARSADELVRWGDESHTYNINPVGEVEGGSGGGGGIRAGEEVRNHYCDIELSVRDRREWAVGALGGLCMCERCLWEEEREEREKKNS